MDPKFKARLADALVEEGVATVKEGSGKGVPKGKFELSGSPYNFRQFNGNTWKGMSMSDFGRLEKLVNEGYEMFGGDNDVPDIRSLESEIKHLESELSEKRKELGGAKKMADALKKEGIDPESLYGGYMFNATDEDGVDWEHQPDGWYRN